MKKITAVILILAILFSLYGCSDNKDDKLTIDVINELVEQKGEALSWSDFEQYPSAETGSGLYILVYNVGKDYQLWIGGTPNEKPMYIRLAHVDNLDDSIDIRYDNIEQFLERTKK